MKNRNKKALAILSALSMVVGLVGATPISAQAKEVVEEVATSEAANAGEHTVWFVGDSTVCNYVKEDGTHTDAKYYYPRYGYGTQFENYIDSSYTVKNVAASGRSTISFPVDSAAEYNELKSGIKAGDYLVIGFGHNDEKPEAARYTNPNTDVDTEGSFQKSLYDNYVKVAQDAGATAILCTPMTRLDKTDAYTGSVVHVTKDATDTDGKSYPGGDYCDAIKKLGVAKNIPVVDVCSLTSSKWKEVGYDKAVDFHAWLNSKVASVDATHPNIYGGKMIAYMLAKAIQEQKIGDLAEHIDLSKGEPTKEKDLVENPDYVEVPYTAPADDAKGSLGSDFVLASNGLKYAFRPTAFGNIGGVPTTSNFNMTKVDDTSVRIKCGGGKGKIAAASDGIAMYYLKLPSTASFSIKADVTINKLNANSQAAFGLMARDDMYIDLNDSAIASDYVVAGSIGTGCNCFNRRGGVTGGKAAFAAGTKLEAGSTYALEITSNPDGYMCKFGNEAAQTAGYDFQLKEKDPDYVYIGMFATRDMDVTFSNISVVTEGYVPPVIKHNIKVTSADEEQGTVSVNIISAEAGEKIELAVEPKAGYMFKQWVVAGDVVKVAEDNTFIMPEADVEITAEFIKEPDFSKGEAMKLGVELVDGAAYDFTGGNVTPKVAVYYNRTQLVENVDYKVTYKNNKNVYEVAAGDKNFDEKKAPTVIVKAIGNYKGTAVATFTIANNKASEDAADVKGYKLVVPDEYKKGVPYTGYVIDPVDFGFKVQPKSGDAISLDEVKASVATSNNVNAGTASLLLTGKGGSMTKLSYKIAKADINKAEITVSDNAVYSGSGAKASVTVSYNGMILTEGKDYKLTYMNNKSVDKKGSVVVAGMGNFAGKTAAKEYTINPLSVDDVTVVAPSVAVGSKADKAVVMVFDKDGNILKAKKDYVLTVAGDASKEGNILSYVVDGTQGTTKALTGKKEGSIVVAPAGALAVDAKSAVAYYTGKQINVDSKLAVSFKKKGDSTATKLTNGTEYATYYVPSAKVGKATIYVYGIDGKAAGFKKISVKVNAALIK